MTQRREIFWVFFPTQLHPPVHPIYLTHTHNPQTQLACSGSLTEQRPCVSGSEVQITLCVISTIVGVNSARSLLLFPHQLRGFEAHKAEFNDDNGHELLVNCISLDLKWQRGQVEFSRALPHVVFPSFLSLPDRKPGWHGVEAVHCDSGVLVGHCSLVQLKYFTCGGMDKATVQHRRPLFSHVSYLLSFHVHFTRLFPAPCDNFVFKE